MQIRTRFESATDTKGERIIAFAEGKQKSMAYRYALDPITNHSLAARKLFKKLNPESKERWSDVLYITRSKRGYMFEVTELTEG